MCDPTSELGLIQSVSSPVLSLLGAAALTPNQKENSTSCNKQQIFQFPPNPIPITFTTHNNPHNTTNSNNGLHRTLNQDAVQISTFNFDYNNNNTNTELKYRSIDICTQSIEHKHQPFDNQATTNLFETETTATTTSTKKHQKHYIFMLHWHIIHKYNISQHKL